MCGLPSIPLTVPHEREHEEDCCAVADGLHVDPSQFVFRWVDHLKAEANLNSGVISVHFPQINRLFSNVSFLREWERKPGFGDEWVDFGGREDVVRRITEHLLGHGPQCITHCRPIGHRQNANSL